MTTDLSSYKSIFREYDIRGIYPSELDLTIVRATAEGLGNNLFKNGKVFIGRDGRHSSPEIYDAIKETLSQNKKLEIIELGIITTPSLYYIVRTNDASGGLMVTASHNPKEHNGIKVVGKNAEFIGGKEVYALIS